MNKVFLIGRLTNQPKMRYTSEGTPVASFGLAVNRIYDDNTDFFNIIVWNKQGENCSKYLEKGSQIAVEGHIQSRTYQNQNGKSKKVTEIIAEHIQFLNTKRKEEKGLSKEPFGDFGKEIEQGKMNLYPEPNELPW